MDNKVLDEAVETYLQVECQAINGDDTEYLRCSDRDREIVRAALLAGVKVLLGEPVAWVVDDGGEEVIKFTPEFLEAWRGGLDISDCKFYAPSLGEGDGR